MDIKSQINLDKLPRHIAVIMDGNGRWAKQHNKPRVFGHRNGVRAVRETAEAAAEIGVDYLTLYAFSTENWNRPKIEVDALMTLLVNTLRNEINTLNQNNIRLQAIGALDSLPPQCFRELMEAIENTKHNTRMTMVLALNYSGKWELTHAIKKLVADVQSGKASMEGFDASVFANYLATAGMPDPELLIRTSGEYRLSNFLLWQLAYAEFYFTPVLWPDFNREHFYRAIVDFQQRERRFGKTGEQITDAK